MSSGPMSLPATPVAGLRLALDFLLPPRCVACDSRTASQEGLCAACWQKTPFLERPWCQRLGLPFSHDVGEGAWSPQAFASPPVYDRLRSVAFHQGPARNLVHALKFSRRRDLAVPMGRWMARAGGELLDADCLVVPVPLHWFRLVSRRFNQAADLARIVADECGARHEPALLARRKYTRPQPGLQASDRQKNMRGAFRVDASGLGVLPGRHVVLIDDVITTGSTVTACTRVLMKAGAASVDVLTFAHAARSNAIGDGSAS